LFSLEEFVDCNCTGIKGKQALKQRKLERVKNCGFKTYPVQPSQKELQWKKGLIAAEAFLRGSKRSSVLEHQD